MSTSFEIFRQFLLISGVKSLKKVSKWSKRLKKAEKSVSTSFRVCAAPKSWSKYTTVNHIIFVCPFTCQSLNRQKLNYKTRISVFAQAEWTDILNILTQSKSRTQITRSVHCKFNFITVKYNGTRHGIYVTSLLSIPCLSNSEYWSHQD